MIHHTKEFFIANTIAIFSVLDKTEYSEEERLILFANEIMEYTIKYSGLEVILKEADMLKDEDEISKSIVEVTKELHLKMESLLNQVVGGNAIVSKFNIIIFMSSIIYPINKSNILNFDRSIVDVKEKRIEYIKHIIDLMRS